MYAIYFKQPTKEYCKYRFTYDNWHRVKQFYDRIHNDANFIQARMVFWRLWKANAFHFVESEMEYGLESAMSTNNRNEKVVNFQKLPCVLDAISMMRCESKGLLTAMDILQVGYNEMKEHLAKTNQNCVGLRPSTIVNEIVAEIDKIEGHFKPSAGRENRKNKNDTVESGVDEHMSSDSDDTYDPDEKYEDIGCVRSELKRKAMAQQSKSLIHGSTYCYAEQSSSSSPEKSHKPSPIKERKPTKAELASPEKNNKNQPAKVQLASPRVRKKIEFDDQRGTVRIVQTAVKRTTPRILKNSTVRKQFTNCPP